MKYTYQVHLVTDTEYEQADIGSLFRNGIVVNGLAGMGDDALVVTACPDFTVVLPEGWRAHFASGKVVAVHPNHPPRAISAEIAESVLFRYWPELKLLE